MSDSQLEVYAEMLAEWESDISDEDLAKHVLNIAENIEEFREWLS